MRRHEGHAQVMSCAVVAQQHHRRPLGAGQLGKKLRLAHERLTETQDGFFIERRSDERIDFLAQRALGAVSKIRESGARCGSSARDQIWRQRF